MRYSRFLSPEFVQHLSGEPLSSLLRLPTLCDFSDAYAIDFHLREGDRLMLYHGTTALLTVQLDRSTNRIKYSAAEAYSRACGFQELMQAWPESDWNRSVGLTPQYLTSAITIAKDGDYRNQAEGYWQNRLSLAFGSRWCPGMDWLIIDREAVVGFTNSTEKQDSLAPLKRKYQSVRDQFCEQDSGKWGSLSTKGFGDECDFLALGPAGELFCIELKHGSNTSGIYWGCLQVAVYRDLFERALDQITEDVKLLVRQKIQLGLLPLQADQRIPEGAFRTVQPVLAVADPNDRSACWKRLEEVMLSCADAKCTVVEIRNYQDPAPIPRL